MTLRNTEYLIESIIESQGQTKVTFNDYVIIYYNKIIAALKELNNVHRNIELVNLIAEYSKIKVDGGYQYTFHGFGKSNEDGPITYHRNEYPPALKDGWVISEFNLEYRIYSKLYNINIYGKNMIIKPTIAESNLNEILTILKHKLFDIRELIIITAKEFLNSAIIDFVSGRYRSSSHNIYYSLYNIIKSTQTEDEIINNELRHGSELKPVLMNIFQSIKTGNHPIFKFKEADVLKNLDFDAYMQTIDDAYELRQKADYKINFFAGIFAQKLFNVIIRVDQLFQIIKYLHDISISLKKDELLLHWPIFEKINDYPIEQISVEDEFIAFSGLIISPIFNTSTLIIELLSYESLYYTPHHYLGKDPIDYGRVSTEEGRYIISITSQPEINYIPLTLENAKKWSDLTKPSKLKYLTEKNKNNSIDFIFSEVPFTLELLKDGRFYLKSKIDIFMLPKNWDALKQFIILFYETNELLFGPQFRMVLINFFFDEEIFIE